MLLPQAIILNAISSLFTLSQADMTPSPNPIYLSMPSSPHGHAPALTGIAGPITTRRMLTGHGGQQVGTETTTIVDVSDLPISVCGYFDRIGINHKHFNQPFACADSKWCGTDEEHGWFGCCVGKRVDPGGVVRPDRCLVQTRCVGNADMGSCPGACKADYGILKCTESKAHHCHSRTMVDASLTNYFCGATEAVSADELWLTKHVSEASSNSTMSLSPTPNPNGTSSSSSTSKIKSSSSKSSTHIATGSVTKTFVITIMTAGLTMTDKTTAVVAASGKSAITNSSSSSDEHGEEGENLGTARSEAGQTSKGQVTISQSSTVTTTATTTSASAISKAGAEGFAMKGLHVLGLVFGVVIGANLGI